MITAVFSPSRPLADRARDVAAVAAQFAAAVDAEGRFPHEMLAAAREARLLSALVPTEFGGDGASITEVAETCTIVAQACGSSGMVLAMHHIQIGCLVRHVRGYQVFEAYLAEIAERDRRDTTRAVAPLVAVPEAVVVDSTALTIEEVVGRVIELARERFPEAARGL